VNAYDQLHSIREDLERRGARPETLALVDRFIAQAEAERDNPLSISQPMILRHLLGQRDVLNNEVIHMDMLALAGDLDERRPVRNEDDAPDATVDTDRRPHHLRSYYKKQKEKERQGRRS
jgi:hypothetical protein